MQSVQKFLIVFQKKQMLFLVILFFKLITICSLQKPTTQPTPKSNISNDSESPPSEIWDIMNVMGHVSDTFIKRVNNRTNGQWTAGDTFLTNYSLQSLRKLASRNPVIDPQTRKFYILHRKLVLNLLPQEFNVIENWPKCGDLIFKVPEIFSSLCALGWVMTMASVLTDRLCILSRASKKTELSPMDIIKCCNKCSSHGNLCHSGGDALMAWKFWLKHGIVSGDFSGVDNIAGCKPYNNVTWASTSCHKECDYSNRSKYSSESKASSLQKRQIEYNREKRLYSFGKNIHILPRDTKYIKGEIIRHGPVQTAFKLFEDFFVYRNGVYEHVHGEFIGYHSVKMVGWGAENGLHYWLIVNSWGRDFGMNGTAKFLRGINHCEIEENVIASDYTRLNKTTLQTRKQPVNINSASHLVNSYHTFFFIIAFIVYSAL